MRIGLLGGTFDPIHNGHLSMADEARLKFNLDEIWFIPNGNSYQKNNITDANIRAEMVEAAIVDIPWAKVSYVEIDRGGPSYTADTLAELKKLYPDNEYFLIVGADAFKQIAISWHSPQYIFDNCTIIVAYRSDLISTELTNSIVVDYIWHWNAKVLEMPFYSPLSSTWIREKINTGSSYFFDVRYLVYKIIEENNLYKENKNG